MEKLEKDNDKKIKSNLIKAGGLRGSGDTKYIAKYTILTDVFLKVILSYICVTIWENQS